GVSAEQSASFAGALLEAGVESVLAMQTSVSDRYATELATEFFRALSGMGRPRPAVALAQARRACETRRLERLNAASPLSESAIQDVHPEYATATLYVRGDDQVLADFDATREPLRARSVLDLGGPVLQLDMEDLVGRRVQLR